MNEEINKKKYNKNIQKNILFCITSLDFGGAERVLIDTLNVLSKKNINYNYTILTIYNNGDLERELNNNIKVISLFKKEKKFLNKKIYMKYIGFKIKNNVYINYLVKKKLKENNMNLRDFKTVVAYLEGPATTIISSLNHNNKIAFIHTDLEQHYKNKHKTNIINIYKNFRKIVFVSKSSKKGFLKITDLYNSKEIEDKTEVIHNFINTKRIVDLSLNKNKNKVEEEIGKKEYFLTISRLRMEKGVLRLLEVFKNRKERIVIIGDGVLRKEIEEKIKEEKLLNIQLLGSKSNPYPYLKYARALIIPSFYEGYSTTAKEAEVLNKFVISTKTGVEEALENYDKKIFNSDINKGIDEFMKLEKNVINFNEDINKDNIKNVEIENDRNLKRILKLFE